ncbi:hypothetical protein NDU88_004074 [Pleurodeles waltl]|uniref:Uncharacterized protein n=1 Tax=Pleurodeles waltl TaxID=8319 RepID=A0AAV7W7C5_PLEWA|nr:hypothetical protein NDU88_004074 [Pleurodeles waltl]
MRAGRKASHARQYTRGEAEKGKSTWAIKSAHAERRSKKAEEREEKPHRLDKWTALEARDHAPCSRSTR